jgi:hypothetical protein
VTGTSLRNRILAIALVPSLSLLVLGGAASGYFLYQGFRKQEFANRVSDGNPTISRFVVALQEERRASMRTSSAGASQKPGMAQQRKLTDGQFAEGQQIQVASGPAPEDLQRAMGVTLTTLGELPRVRQRVDAGQSSVQDLDTTYSGMVREHPLAAAGAGPVRAGRPRPPTWSSTASTTWRRPSRCSAAARSRGRVQPDRPQRPAVPALR